MNISAHAQQQPPKLLVDAARCLTTKGFLPATKTTTLNSGYLVDSKSYPGERVLYVVIYMNPQRSHGMVFSIFLTHKGSRQVFNIQNNAEFVRSGKEGAAVGTNDVDFVNGGDPLGGVWTQEHIVLAIKKIGLQAAIEVPVKSLSRPIASTQCKSYVDTR